MATRAPAMETYLKPIHFFVMRHVIASGQEPQSLCLHICRSARRVVVLGAVLTLVGIISRYAAAKDATSAVAANVDEASVRANEASTREWPVHGLDFAGTRFSKLDQINALNVKNLGLAWSYDLSSNRGIEATPLVVGGVMYVTASWSIVHAIDVGSGKNLWTYDPKVPRRYGYHGCCDVVNRGVALYHDKVFVGSFDGRLIALDAKTGAKVWEQDTVKDQPGSYTITQAPIVIKGKVIIGNSGGEFDTRGYVSAYDAESGKQLWRWFIVPGDPSKPFENASMKLAAKTWDPSAKYWKHGGGGNAWNALTYDPDLNLLYIGTGNGTPWAARLRSPKLGRNLFLDSIVALNPDTGKYVWHYQEEEAEGADHDSTADFILADLTIDGKPRKVIMHAPKNGYFFVIDRVTGKFISANNFVDVNWASGYDASGRAIKTKIGQGGTDPVDAIPSPFGAHNWQPMSYNPQTGLVYIPAQNVPATIADDPVWLEGSEKTNEPQTGTGWNLGMTINAVPPKSKPFGRLVAWDPVRQKAAWTREYAAPWNGGTLTMAGDLVFQGTADGRLVAYNAKTGDTLWETSVGTGAIAPPVTYFLNGKQYVSIAVGWGGVYGLMQRHTDRQAPGRVLTFALGGKASMPETAAYPTAELLTGVKYDHANVNAGQKLYVNNCVFCHGVPGVDKGGAIPNLGYVGSGLIENLDKIVFNGPFVDRGMPDFSGKLSKDDVVKIQAFIQGTADSVRKSQ
jgi:quinohemoprotein ethanol dehydrogenase